MEERRRSFYMYWVRQFFSLHQGKQSRRDLGRADIEAFLETLTSDPSVADWQVAQARDALEIYYEQFRGIALASSQKTYSCASEASGQSGVDCAASGNGDRSKSAVHDLQKRGLTPRIAEQPEITSHLPCNHPRGWLDMRALEEAVRSALLTEHYALKTEKAYVH